MNCNSPNNGPVPALILDNLICQNCFSYMTVLPIYIQSNGEQKCGRCISSKKQHLKSSKPFCLIEDDRWEDVYNMLVVILGYASYTYLFPCVNKEEGCKELLRLEDVEKHEELCVVKKIQCPLCSFRGVGTQLINHFKHLHHKFFQNQRVDVVLNTTNSYKEIVMFSSRFPDLLLLVKVLFELEARHFSINISSINNSAPRVIRLLFRVKYGTERKSKYLKLLSERLTISKGNSYQISFQINDFHVFDAPSVKCAFNVLI